MLIVIKEVVMAACQLSLLQFSAAQSAVAALKVLHRPRYGFIYIRILYKAFCLSRLG